MNNKLRSDKRGVSEVIGAILVFGLMISLIAIMQTYAIPAANEQVEFNHQQQVQSDLVEFQEASSRVATTGTSVSTKIQVGTTYPSRLIFFNPRPPSGEVRVVGDQPASIQNVTAIDGHVQDYIDGSITGLETKRLEYNPNYNEYKNAPTTRLEYGALYRDYGDEVVVDNPGGVISGNTISLTFFNGDMSRAQGGSMALEAQATSAPARTVTVRPSGGPMVLRLPSDINASRWDEIVGDEEHVEDVRSAGGGDYVAIELNQSETYSLRMAQIGVGSGVPSPEARYITRASNEQLTIGQANQLPIEVRDKYNNPVSGKSLNISVDTGSFKGGSQIIETNTTDDGRPAAQYFGSGAGIVEVRASYARETDDVNFDQDNREDVRFNVSFNPRLDDEKPEINSLTTSEQTHQVCTAFTEISLVGTSLLGCSTTSTSSQIVAEYDVEDSGGAGLDYIQMDIQDSSGNTIINATESLRGASSQGTMSSPQIVHSELSEPASVDIYVVDRNGNRVAEIDSWT